VTWPAPRSISAQDAREGSHGQQLRQDGSRSCHALIIAVWLIAYAALMILHDRSAGSAGRGDWRRETTVQISDLLRPTTNGIFAMIERLEDAG
jgi:hypothetical protein